MTFEIEKDTQTPHDHVLWSKTPHFLVGVFLTTKHGHVEYRFPLILEKDPIF